MVHLGVRQDMREEAREARDVKRDLNERRKEAENAPVSGEDEMQMAPGQQCMS